MSLLKIYLQTSDLPLSEKLKICCSKNSKIRSGENFLTIFLKNHKPPSKSDPPLAPNFNLVPASENFLFLHPNHPIDAHSRIICVYTHHERHQLECVNFSREKKKLLGNFVYERRSVEIFISRKSHSRSPIFLCYLF
jgi:hypothetical protein